MNPRKSPEIDSSSALEELRRFWHWVVFIIQLFARIGGVGDWKRTLQRLVSILLARFIAQQNRSLTSSSFPTCQYAFYQSSEFAFIRSLEVNWQIILDELEHLQGKHFIPWSERFLYKQGWSTLGLYAYGVKIQKNCSLCPETTKLVEQIPNLITAGFSSLAPGTHIAPHTGYPDGVLRCHLGLIIPDRCAIRIGDETQTWREGKCLIFNDTIEHEAWNDSDRTRIVLLIDFQAPSALQL